MTHCTVRKCGIRIGHVMEAHKSGFPVTIYAVCGRRVIAGNSVTGIAAIHKADREVCRMAGGTGAAYEKCVVTSRTELIRF